MGGEWHLADGRQEERHHLEGWDGGWDVASAKQQQRYQVVQVAAPEKATSHVASRVEQKGCWKEQVLHYAEG